MGSRGKNDQKRFYTDFLDLEHKPRNLTQEHWTPTTHYMRGNWTKNSQPQIKYADEVFLLEPWTGKLVHGHWITFLNICTSKWRMSLLWSRGDKKCSWKRIFSQWCYCNLDSWPIKIVTANPLSMHGQSMGKVWAHLGCGEKKEYYREVLGPLSLI